MNSFFPPFNMYHTPFNMNRPRNSNFYIPPSQYKISNIPKRENVDFEKDMNEDKKIDQDKGSSSNKPILDFFGIRLYNDDVLILLLIYFLYKENVNDMLLLVALFSLLF